MTILHAILLGIIQGATEFLPISSSAHLVFAQHFLIHQLSPTSMLAFDICLHFGTLIAVIVYFRRDLGNIVRGKSRQLGWMLIVGTIPAGVAGVMFKRAFEMMFSDAMSTCWQLILTGGMLWATRWMKEGNIGLGAIGFMRALWIGAGQAIAIIPGISRSGSTIAAALWLGMERDAAARYSFLLSIPAIAGATLLSIRDLQYFSQHDLLAASVGTFASFLVGISSIKWLLGIIRRGHLSWFAIYCWVVGAAGILFFTFHK